MTQSAHTTSKLHGGMGMGTELHDPGVVGVSSAAVERVAAPSARASAPALGIRGRLALWAVVGDVVAAFVGFQVALLVFSWFHGYRGIITPGSFDWSLVVTLVAILGSFLYCGLYDLEAWVSRPLHLQMLLKGTLIAVVIAAAFAFAFKAPIVTESRLTLFSAFAVFLVLDAWVRIGLLDRLYRGDVQEHAGATVVIGHSPESSILVSRLKELRGYGRILALEPQDGRRNGFDAEPALLEALAAVRPLPRQVFIDGPSVGHKATFDLIAAAYDGGSDVYIAGRLVSALDTTRLLLRLFELPVMRVRCDPEATPAPRAAGVERVVKRVFDVIVAAAALVLLAPAFAVIAVLLKRDSPGPVFFRQERIGRDGATFELLKLRTMTVGNDESAHRGYVCSLIENGAAACFDEQGLEVYKLVDDERVTGVGRFLRKWSIDELPQFWNVLRGDMSVVGPRPALEYEVAAYQPWHRRRLDVQPGVSGLWQVAGRSRVGFDEMVFQDVMYGYNQSLITDVNICLRTVPVVLMGRGAA